MREIVNLLVLGLWVVMVMPLAVKGIAANTTVSSSLGVPKVVNVGALFTLNSVIGRSAKPAVVAAIDDINSSPDVLRGTRLNLILHDTNCSGFLGTIGGIFSLCAPYF
jgi:glutamate receptor, ionotropic, plant